jgi:hypothetical protein
LGRSTIPIGPERTPTGKRKVQHLIDSIETCCIDTCSINAHSINTCSIDACSTFDYSSRYTRAQVYKEILSGQKSQNENGKGFEEGKSQEEMKEESSFAIFPARLLDHLQKCNTSRTGFWPMVANLLNTHNRIDTYHFTSRGISDGCHQHGQGRWTNHAKDLRQFLRHPITLVQLYEQREKRRRHGKEMPQFPVLHNLSVLLSRRDNT